MSGAVRVKVRVALEVKLDPCNCTDCWDGEPTVQTTGEVVIVTQQDAVMAT